MSLKKEITLILLVVITLFTVLEYTVQRFVIFPSYRELDQGRARDDLGRGLAALQREILHLDELVHDWSAWDDSLRFINDQNAAYVESNLGANTFQDNRLSAIYFLDLGGRIVWGRSYAKGAPSPLDLAVLPGKTFPADNSLLRFKTARDSLSGLLLTEAGPLLIAARPIVDSEKTLPPAGTLLMGRLLGQEEMAAITARTGSELNIWACDGGLGGHNRSVTAAGGPECLGWGDAVPGVEDLRAIGKISAETPVVLREEDGSLSAYGLVHEAAGNGFLVLHGRSAMAISAVGRQVQRGAMLSLLCVGLLILVVLLEALKFSVLKPLALLTSHAEALRRNEKRGGNISTVLHARNEIGLLAREFDSMVAQLDLARQRLAEQSYYSGMTEMASGGIHNLRNALTPVTANLDLLREDFRDLPLSQMKRAGDELEQGEVFGERREMLARYLRESLDYLGEIMADVENRLKAMDSGVAQVEKILSNQEKFIAVNRGAEVIELAPLIREAANLVNLNCSGGLELRFDPSLIQVGAVTGQRTALLHVFANLLGNAREAVSHGKRSSASIDIRAELDRVGDQELVHVKIRDNGCGISTLDLPHLFERGFTTKDNGVSGIGLHWCANTITAMHGRLWAESGGRDQGATLHLLLPKVIAES